MIRFNVFSEVPGAIRRFIFDLKRYIGWIPYRIKHGFFPDDLWGLNSTIIKFTLPRLKEFRRNVHDYPCDLNNTAEWQAVLDEIIWAFENYDELPADKEVWARFDKAMDFWGKYFCDLWY